jgi:hypothetical protein
MMCPGVEVLKGLTGQKQSLSSVASGYPCHTYHPARTNEVKKC